jgi:photosystem II stability/assembly factor-like uncharacterized protein
MKITHARNFFLLLLFLSGNLSAQWMQLPQDTNNLYCDVYFLNSDTGFIAGENVNSDLLIQRTTDGGNSWSTVLFSNGPLGMCIRFGDDTTGYCGGQGGMIYKTTDMGNSWSNAGLVASNIDISAMIFTSRDTGFVSDFAGRIYKTTDGAASWTMVSVIQSSFTNFYPGTGKFQFLDDSTGFLANGNYGQVMKTVDGGNTWTPIDLPNSGSWALSVYMFNKDTGMIVSEAGKIWRTTNGTSWLGSWIGTPYDLLDITFFNDTVGYIVGGENNNFIFHPPPFPAVGGIIYVSYDRGVSWHPDTTLSSDWLTSIYNAGNNVAYTAGWHGWVYKLTNANVNVGVKENVLNEELKIFPNPSNGRIYIESSLENFDVEISDMQGRIVYKTENEKYIDAGFLENGIYLISLNGIFTDRIIINH